MKTSTVRWDGQVWMRSHGALRTDAYVLLAALLTESPSEEKLQLVGGLRWNDGLPQILCEALTDLTEAASSCSLAQADEEYRRIFVGLGCGEMVPYKSWYVEKTIQSDSLARIRADLAQLGIVRQVDSIEPEDHAGALCEVMALLSVTKNGASGDAQADFFRSHIRSWMMRFFRDLEETAGAGFYTAVGRFGRCFLEIEDAYLQHVKSGPEDGREVGVIA